MVAPLSKPTMRICPHCDSLLGARAVACSACFRSTAVCGGFRLGEELGHGGLGTVFAAETDAGQPAAVKVLAESALNPAEVLRVFCDSARLLATLAHPGLPRVLGFEARDHRSFLALERLDGGTLAQQIMAGKRFVDADLHALLDELLAVVAHLHERAILHGDVTPRNVMFRAGEPRPVLIDFDGIAAEGVARSPTLVITPGYTAPEQRTGEVSVEADLYGIGATVYYAATGRSPNSLERHGGRPDLSRVRADAVTKAVIGALLHLDPARRPSSAAFARRLLAQPAVAEATITVAPPRRRVFATVAAAALAAAIGITVAIGTSYAAPMERSTPAGQR